ncbi:MAG TPA: HEAT repeat domain-containing protein, partial [Kofleriaceae bacterium]|nr:HEAT repeat domain-containing protein [Kofleriaceae bacterium]
LSDSLFSGRPEEARYAAGVLGRIGTEESRQALIAALGDKDKNLAAAAAGALGQSAFDDSVKGALLSAAQSNPAVKMQVMNHLLRAGAPEGLRLAEDLIDGKNARAASSAVWALASQGTPEARQLVERALSAKDASVRTAAISTLSNNPDEHSTDTLLRLTRDGDAGVRTAALQTLGQIGSDKAQAALLEAARGGKTEERVAAISGLSNLDDPQVGRELATLMRDPDPQVAQVAVHASFNGGPEVDQALVRIVNDPSAKDELKMAAASQLRGRGTDLDDTTEKTVAKLAGPAYGGYGYGGMYGDYIE